MYKHLLTIIIGLLSISDINGQIQNDLKTILASKDLIAFKKYSDNLSNSENNIRSFYENLRDITTNYQEGVFVFEKSIPDKDHPTVSTIQLFRVTLIATETTIIFYEISEQKHKKEGDDYVPYYEPFDKFIDQAAFDKLKTSFQNIFQTDLNETELFVMDFVYGSHCGYSGTNPKGRQQLDEWVKTKNKAEILKWLKSTNTEKQVYAVDGLKQLKKAGEKITEEEIKIINFICNKKGMLYTCFGCMHTQEKIKSVARKFKQ